MKKAPSGIAASVLAYLLWGFITIYWKHLTRFNAFELIGHRILWSSILLTVVIVATSKWRAVLGAFRTPKVLGQMALAAVLLTTNWTSYVYAVVHGRVIETALGYFIAPIGTMLVGVYAMKEPFRMAQRVALVLAAAAVIVVGVAYGRVPVIALLLGTSWCAYGYVKRHIPLASVESLAGETLLLAVPAAILVAARQTTGSGIFQVGTTTQIVLVLLSAVVTATPLVLFAYAAKRTPFTILGPIGYLVPTINFLLGVLVYHEQLTGARVVGFSLVWVALIMLTVDGLR